jgi:hypothetical protein
MEVGHTSTLIEDQCKVIFTRERMSRIRALRIVEDFELVVVVDDSCGSLGESGGGLDHDSVESVSVRRRKRERGRTV